MGKRGRAWLSAGDMAQIGLFTAVMAVCAWISIPTVIPLTMQTFAVFLAAGLLGMKKGALTVIVYILAAAAGAPVLSGFRGGLGALLGPTGGYLVGFIFVALIAGYGIKRFGSSAPVMAASMALGMAVCYAFGTAWYLLAYSGSSGAAGLGPALSMCVVPYIVPDIVKIGLAVLLAKRLAPRIAAGAA